jgi:hypothetical protein
MIEVYDNDNVRSEFAKKVAQMPLADYSHQVIQLGAGADLSPVIMPTIPITGFAIFTDQALYVKFIDQINCPYIPVTSYLFMNTSNINNIYLSNPGGITANIEIFAFVKTA